MYICRRLDEIRSIAFPQNDQSIDRDNAISYFPDNEGIDFRFGNINLADPREI